jgi:hypothetical protein
MLLATLVLTLVGALVAATTRPRSGLVPLGNDYIACSQRASLAGDVAASDLAVLDRSPSSSDRCSADR